MSSNTVLLISDIHTNYHVINSQIEHAEEHFQETISQVFVLGDFGFFGDELHEYFRKKNNRFLRPVSFIEGNHEDYGSLEQLTHQYADVAKHLDRGSLHRLGPWTGLCIGGASYIDSITTPRGCEITDLDMEACMAHPPHEVDLILSHDCPVDLGVPGSSGLVQYRSTGEPLLNKLAGHFQPRWWFFGHHHRWFDLEKGGTRYIGLPQSWEGFLLLKSDGEVEIVQHNVSIESRSWIKRILMNVFG